MSAFRSAFETYGRADLQLRDQPPEVDELIASLTAAASLWTPGAIFVPRLLWITPATDATAAREDYAHFAQISYALICAVVLITTAMFVPLAFGHFALCRRQVELAEQDVRRHRRNLPRRKLRAKEELVRRCRCAKLTRRLFRWRARLGSSRSRWP